MTWPWASGMRSLVELRVDGLDEAVDGVAALGEEAEDLAFTFEAVVEELLDLGLGLVYGGAVAGVEGADIQGLELAEGVDVPGHVPAVGADGGGAGAEDVVAGEEGAIGAVEDAGVAVGVARGVDHFEFQAAEVQDIAIIEGFVDAGVFEGLVGGVGVVVVDKEAGPGELLEPLGAAEVVGVGVGEDDVAEVGVAELFKLFEAAVDGMVVAVAGVYECAFTVGYEIGVGRVVAEKEGPFDVDVEGVKAGS